MRDRGSYRPSGSFANLTGKRAKAIRKSCERCGAGISGGRKRYCRPCVYDNARQQARERYHRNKEATSP